MSPPSARAAHVVNAAVAAWVVAAPAALGYGGPMRLVDEIVGPVAAACALVAAWEATRGMRYGNVLAGAAVIVAALASPTAVAAVNSVLTGAGMVALALAGGPIRARFGGGWAAVCRPAP